MAITPRIDSLSRGMHNRSCEAVRLGAASVLAGTIGFSGPTAPAEPRADERSHTTHACRSIADRTCGAEGKTKGDTDGRHDAVLEGAISGDFAVNRHFAPASVASVPESAKLLS